MTYAAAEKILGKNLITPYQIMEIRRSIRYPMDNFFSIGNFFHFTRTLPSLEILEWGRTHNCLLLPGPGRPLSLLMVRHLRRGYFQCPYGGWELQHPYAEKDTVDPKWFMVRTEIIPESTAKDWDSQSALIPENETLLNAAEIAWCMVVYRALFGSRFWSRRYTRTTSKVAPGRTIIVGDVRKGIDINFIAPSQKGAEIGLLTQLKLD